VINHQETIEGFFDGLSGLFTYIKEIKDGQSNKKGLQNRLLYFNSFYLDTLDNILPYYYKGSGRKGSRRCSGGTAVGTFKA
jgi:hypothetical protein